MRTAPDRLSFATPQAYHDIYSHVKHGHKRFLKNKWYMANNQEPRITRVRDPQVHAEQRKALSHAFSAKALRDQERIIHQYVNALMNRLNELGEGGNKPIDVTTAWNWLTFDVIGDLAFGEPFDAIRDGSDHWFHLMASTLRRDSTARTMHKYGFLLPLILRFMLPKPVLAAAEDNHRLASEKAHRRIELGDMGRADFFSHIISKLTPRDIVGNAEVLLLAGSETTSTTLTSLTFYLLSNPECLQKLNKEVREAFAATGEHAITAESVAQLPYLHGCIEETLRIFPTVTVGLPRDCPGAVIDGHYVPEGVVVSSEVTSMHLDPRWWKDPDSFRPERWVGEGFAGDDRRRAFQPFSTGPRACLGINMAYLEMKIAVAKLVWRYDLAWGGPKIEGDWKENCVDAGLWRKPPLMVKFHPRKVAQ